MSIFFGAKAFWAMLARELLQSSLNEVLNKVISLEDREKVINTLRRDGFLRVRVGFEVR